LRWRLKQRPRRKEMKFIKLLVLVFLAACLMPALHAVSAMAGMKEGPVGLKSAGPITFGNDGVLFVADSKAAAIVAIDTQDVKAATKSSPLKIEKLNEKLAAVLGTSADQILVNDMAANPISHNVYLAVSRG